MNADQIKGRWRQWMGAAKQQWGKLTDDDFTQAEGSVDKLAGCIQERYGYTKERAREELDTFFRRDDLVREV